MDPTLHASAIPSTINLHAQDSGMFAVAYTINHVSEKIFGT